MWLFISQCGFISLNVTILLLCLWFSYLWFYLIIDTFSLFAFYISHCNVVSCNWKCTSLSLQCLTMWLYFITAALFLSHSWDFLSLSMTLSLAMWICFLFYLTVEPFAQCGFISHNATLYFTTVTLYFANVIAKLLYIVSCENCYLCLTLYSTITIVTLFLS